MAKKDFSHVETKRVYDAIAEATAPADPEQESPKREMRKPRKTYTKEEAQKYLNSMETAGRKGLALPRINLAFTQDNYQYIQTMSRVRGESMTEFVNLIIHWHKDNFGDVYERAQEFIRAMEE